MYPSYIIISKRNLILLLPGNSKNRLLCSYGHCLVGVNIIDLTFTFAVLKKLSCTLWKYISSLSERGGFFLL